MSIKLSIYWCEEHPHNVLKGYRYSLKSYCANNIYGHTQTLSQKNNLAWQWIYTILIFKMLVLIMLKIYEDNAAYLVGRNIPVALLPPSEQKLPNISTEAPEWVNMAAAMKLHWRMEFCFIFTQYRCQCACLASNRMSGRVSINMWKFVDIC